MIRFFTLTFFSLFSLHANAQFKNALLDPGSADIRVGEPTIAISLGNPKNIVAASAPDNIYYSSSGGFSWTKLKLASPLGVQGKPAVISNFKHTLYCFFLSDSSGRNLAVQESGDGGQTWSSGVFTGLTPQKIQDKYWAVTDRKGNLVSAWTQFDKYGDSDPSCESNIYVSTSSNGKKWSKPVRISQANGDCKDDDNTTAGAVPGVTIDGEKVFVTWANQNKIFLDRSFDGGKTWLTNDLPIAEQPGGWNMNIPGTSRVSGTPILLCDNTKDIKTSGILYLVWADQRNGENDTDIWFIRSLNYGDNWTQPLRINNDGKGKHQFSPQVTLDPETGYLYIVYYDRRDYDDAQTDVYLAYSVNNGSSFTNVKISESSFVTDGSVSLERIGISAYKGVIAPIWTRMDNGQTSIWTAVIKHEELESVK